MIAEKFDSRTLANMEVALEQACKLLPGGAEQHQYRRFIASRIVACAERGERTLGGLTEAGGRAANDLYSRATRGRNPTRTGVETPMRQFTRARDGMTEKAASTVPAVSVQQNPRRTAN
jgi:hypothetical protein